MARCPSVMGHHDHDLHARRRLLASRTEAFGETIFSEMSALATAHGAVNLGQGFPDFAPPDFVLAAAARALAAPNHQYARGAGCPQLCSAVADELGAALGRCIDPATEVTVTVGATEALFATTLALIEPGDEVILFEPFYDSYPADVLIAGGAPRFVPLRPGPDGRWGLDASELRSSFNERTKAIFVNTPHNPTGKLFARAELELIAELCQRHDALAVCDEVYAELRYDGASHLSLASLPGMWERTVTISSVGKTFSATGWKIGWAVAAAPLSLGVRRIHQWIPFAVTTPLQLAAAEILREAPERGYYAELRASYQRKRDRLVAVLRSVGLEPFVPEGTYFVVADVSRLGFGDDVACCRRLTTDLGVAAIPPSAFYSQEHQGLARDYARFCFCKRDETLAAAAERLAKLGSRSSR